MVGVMPLYGLHLWIVLAIGIPLRLDVPVAYLAANISIPPFLPFILGSEVEVGAYLASGRFIDVHREALSVRSLGTYFKDAWIGTAVLAPALASVGGALTYLVLSYRKRVKQNTHREGTASQAAPPRHLDPADRVAARYAHGSTATRMYVAGKLKSDPVGAALLALGEKARLGDVLDFGCGRGQLALLLLEGGAARSVQGFDWDDAKVEEAGRAATGLAATFAKGDVRKLDQAVENASADTVLLIDVLHYFREDEQVAILESAARKAKSRIIIRDIDPDRGFRSSITRFQERLTTGARYNRGERVLVRSMSDVTRDLERQGFRVTITPCWGKTPFANVLVVGEREAASALHSPASAPATVKSAALGADQSVEVPPDAQGTPSA